MTRAKRAASGAKIGGPRMQRWVPGKSDPDGSRQSVVDGNGSPQPSTLIDWIEVE